MKLKEILKPQSFVKFFHNPISAWIILSISLLLTIGAYFISSEFIEKRARDRFQFRADEIRDAIQDRLKIYEQVLWSGVAFIYSSDQVDRDEWGKYINTLDINKHWPGIQGVGFSIPVLPEDKKAHIEKIRKEGFSNYQIKPEGDRDFYTSIIYIEPFNWRNQRAFGYDMWSNPVRRAAMARARDEGIAATSGIITLVQETEADMQRGFLTYLPVYETKSDPGDIESRRKDFQGWVYAPFRAKDLMVGILGSQDSQIEFEIFDGETMSQESLLFDTSGTLHLHEPEHKPIFEKVLHFNLQGQPWILYFNTPKNFVMHGEHQPKLVLIAGAFIDLLLFYVIYSLYFINRRAEAIAEQMNQELAVANRDLEVSNKELENFAYIASHDLQEPLRKIINFTDLLYPEVEDHLDEDSRQYFSIIKNAAIRMRILIQDLLNYSRSRQRELEKEKVDLRGLVKGSLQELGEIIESKQAVIHIGNMPELEVSSNLMQQVFTNIIGNGIKYMEQGKSPEIHIESQEQSDHWLISIRDNGIGIRDEFLEDVFEIFRRLHSRSEFEGTGIGLAICKKVVERHGGKIWVESQEGQGSTFFFTLPK